jgi:hypothetical protein
MTTKQQSILPFQMETMPSSDAWTSHAGRPLRRVLGPAFSALAPLAFAVPPDPGDGQAP